MVVVIGGGLGILAGRAAGYLGRFINKLIMRIFDAMFAFPPMLLGFVIIAALGAGTTQVAYAIGLAVVPTLGRVARSLVLRERQRQLLCRERVIGLRSQPRY